MRIGDYRGSNGARRRRLVASVPVGVFLQLFLEQLFDAVVRLTEPAQISVLAGCLVLGQSGRYLHPQGIGVVTVLGEGNVKALIETVRGFAQLPDQVLVTVFFQGFHRCGDATEVDHPFGQTLLIVNQILPGFTVIRVTSQQLVEAKLAIRIGGQGRRTTAQQEGGIISKEAPIHLSNLAYADPKDGKPTRVGFKVLEDGRKVRFAKRSGDLIDG